MKRIFSGFLLCFLFLFCCATAEENLVVDGGFDSGEAWEVDMWYWDDGVSLVSVDVLADGNQAAHIVNYGENDARFEQSVPVEPDCTYRVSGKILCSGLSEGREGATLSIKNTFVHTDSLYDTQGQWQSVEMYGRTGKGQDTLTLMVRLGGYGSLNEGEAWFDDIAVERVESAPVASDVFDFSTLPPASESDAPPTPDAWSGVWPLIAMGLIYLAACALVLRGMRRKGPSPLEEHFPRPGLALGAIAVSAFVLRAILALLWRGYGVDMSCFLGWASRMAQTGPAGFYSSEVFCDYPPGYMWALGAAGWLIRVLRLPLDGRASWLIIKLLPMLLDVAMALLLYAIARKELGSRAALALAGLYAFLPAAILNAAVWGQIDAVLTILLVASMLEAVKGRWMLSLPLYGIAVLVKPQALMFGPLGLLALILEIIGSRHRRRDAGRILAGIGVMLAAMAALTLPFLARLDPALLPDGVEILGKTFSLPDPLKPLAWLLGLYGSTLSSYPYLSINACNFFTLLNQNWASLETAGWMYPFALGMTFLSCLFAGYLYTRGKKRERLFLCSAVLLALMFAFSFKMHERYLFPALAMILVAFVYDRDVRLPVVFALLALTQFLNTGLVFQSEHLIAARQSLNAAISLLNVATALLLAWTGWDICVRETIRPLVRDEGPQFIWDRRERRPRTALQDGLFRPKDWRLGMRRRDWIAMIGLTLVYGVVAFVNLGDTSAPQSSWTSSASGEQITFELEQESDFRMTWYGGICSSTFLVQFSSDGEVWTESHYARYDQGQIFRWLWYDPCEKDDNGEFYSVSTTRYQPVTARYIRITAERAGLVLHEVAFLDEYGHPLPVTRVRAYGGGERLDDPVALVDEQDTVPAFPTYLNSTYFDEIYHARTAYEFLHGKHAYEYTHPPLGKVLIMAGIAAFGMTPFGWRFAGALFGVLMVPLMYLLARQLTRKSSLSFVAAFLLAVDAMHFTQTRIATIDTFPVFFIMLMYLFMIRYCQMSFYHQKLGRTLIPLALCGVSMGLAIASKWIGIYGAAGLAVLLFYTLFLRWREAAYARRNMDSLDADQRRVAQRAVRLFRRNTVYTLLWCLLFFIVVPALIYFFSYYWQMQPEGGLTLERVWDMQVSMYNYHRNISWQSHDFESHWYEWPLIVKPMWYYTGAEFRPSDVVSVIFAMGNPAVWWVGLAALIWVLIRYWTTAARDDRRYLYVWVGFMSQYLPWVLVPRSTFIYHYFASIPFIILATILLLDWIRRRSFAVYKSSCIVLCAVALALLGGFYPILSGLPVARSYIQHLKWFNWFWYL